jgi:hypothetical protein
MASYQGKPQAPPKPGASARAGKPKSLAEDMEAAFALSRAEVARIFAVSRAAKARIVSRPGSTSERLEIPVLEAKRLLCVSRA